MRSSAENPEAYINSLPQERKEAISKLRKVLLENLPEGFEEGMGYAMLSYHVPLSKYPQGYHVNPELPLPFINLASQKSYVALYHMGLYSSPELLEWFTYEYLNYSKRKLDMGKSCIRFKKMEDIPYQLIGQLAAKMTPQEWISTYERSVKR
ncbi:DUF1801 domain-containing protein [Salinimicrobium catena]